MKILPEEFEIEISKEAWKNGFKQWWKHGGRVKCVFSQLGYLVKAAIEEALPYNKISKVCVFTGSEEIVVHTPSANPLLSVDLYRYELTGTAGDFFKETEERIEDGRLVRGGTLTFVKTEVKTVYGEIRADGAVSLQ